MNGGEIGATKRRMAAASAKRTSGVTGAPERLGLVGSKRFEILQVLLPMPLRHKMWIALTPSNPNYVRGKLAVIKRNDCKPTPGLLEEEDSP